MTKDDLVKITSASKKPASEARSDERDDESSHSQTPSDIALRVKALETVLTQKKLIDPSALDEIVDRYRNKVGPQNGAKVVAKAWVDSDYKRRLLVDGSSAIAELGLLGQQGEAMVVVENTESIHNLVVCTLCSCYPWPTLGLPPTWYKSSAYRSRAVIEPRAVLREFGLNLPESVEVRVWDSTAEMRYLVLPKQPSGTAHLNEVELSKLVTRDSMIGVAVL